MSMDNPNILNETVPLEDLKKFERIYHDELSSGVVSRKSQFTYSLCLVRSNYNADIRKGIIMLESLFQTEDNANEDLKRDYLYYLALGNARIKEYVTALQYTKAFLQIEPSNQQVANLESVIRKNMENEGLKGAALAGGAVVVAGALIGLGLALLKKR